MFYLDNAATTPISENVIKEMNRLMDCSFWGNPSSVHGIGIEAKQELKKARARLAELLQVKFNQIYFTSGGSEGNTWALDSLARKARREGKMEIISSSMEHASVLNKLKDLEEQGFIVHYIPYPFTVEKLIAAMNDNTGFVSLMNANNEVGCILPAKAVYYECRKRKIPFHMDCVQAVPHGYFNFEADIITASAHKFNGPKGIGFLFSWNAKLLSPLIFGGKQEGGLRGGTENLPAIGGMVVALEDRIQTLKDDNRQASFKKRRFKKILSALVPDVQFNDRDENTLSTIINFYVPNIDVESVGIVLNNRGIYVSTASACSSGLAKPSHVLKAMGFDDKRASNSIRVSFDYNISEDDIKEAAYQIGEAISWWRQGRHF